MKKLLSFVTKKTADDYPVEVVNRANHGGIEIPIVPLDDFEKRFAKPVYGATVAVVGVTQEREVKNRQTGAKEKRELIGQPAVTVRFEQRHVSPKFLTNLNRHYKCAGITKAEAKKLREIYDRLAKVDAQFAFVSNDAARKEFTRQKGELMRAAETDILTAPKPRDKDSIYAEFDTRRAALKTLRRQIMAEAAPVIETVWGRLRNMARDLACELDTHETGQAERFGVAFDPSELLTTAISMGTHAAPPVTGTIRFDWLTEMIDEVLK